MSMNDEEFALVVAMFQQVLVERFGSKNWKIEVFARWSGPEEMFISWQRFPCACWGCQHWFVNKSQVDNLNCDSLLRDPEFPAPLITAVDQQIGPEPSERFKQEHRELWEDESVRPDDYLDDELPNDDVGCPFCGQPWVCVCYEVSDEDYWKLRGIDPQPDEDLWPEVEDMGEDAI